ncbi:MAG: helix-turn-helix transcriptional regulator [Clostridia bacterium]|nr:helix-turn-helix transcriptional regulator [Clostridia bacterium]
MKLSIGENIRTYRRALNMTQEQLACRLGVTFHSVSRWECGATYPDIELLPTIAKIFSVTVDTLMSCSTELAEKHFEELRSQFTSAADEKNEPALVAILQELRRDLSSYTRCFIPNFYFTVRNKHLNELPKVMEELRALNMAFQKQSNNKWQQGLVIETMAAIEEETHLDEFLDAHATEIDLTKEELLISRYVYLADGEKLKPLRQRRLWNAVCKLCTGGNIWREQTEPPRVEFSEWANKICLSLIHQISNITPDEKHPVSGNGEVDVWVSDRLDLGIRAACYHASTDDPEGAFLILEDTISLLERLVALPPMTKITSTSPAMEDFAMWVDFMQYNSEWLYIMLFEQESRDGWNHGFCVKEYYDALTAPQGWEWFDPIRYDTRYQAYIERVKAIMYAPKEANSTPTLMSK